MNAVKTSAAANMIADHVGAPAAFPDKPRPPNVALMAVSKEPDGARSMTAFVTSPEATLLIRKT